MVCHGLNNTTIVVNNVGWAMSFHGQDILFGEEGEVISRLADTDYDRVAAGFGAHGERVSHFGDFDLAVKRAMEHEGGWCITSPSPATSFTL